MYFTYVILPYVPNLLSYDIAVQKLIGQAYTFFSLILNHRPVKLYLHLT